MGKAQRTKGYRGEKEVEAILNEYGIDAERGLVFMHQPDIMTDTPIHIEVKRQETTKIHEWFKQSESACGNKIPTVVHRRSREPWMITMRFEDFLKLWKGENNDNTER